MSFIRKKLKGEMSHTKLTFKGVLPVPEHHVPFKLKVSLKYRRSLMHFGIDCQVLHYFHVSTFTNNKMTSNQNNRKSFIHITLAVTSCFLSVPLLVPPNLHWLLFTGCVNCDFRPAVSLDTPFISDSLVHCQFCI